MSAKKSTKRTLDEGPQLHTRQPRRTPMADVKIQDTTMVLAPRELLRKEFSRRLAKALRERRWKQADLARKAGIGRDSINGYIRGRMLPSPIKLDAIASALDVEASDLMPNGVETSAERENPMLTIQQSDDSGRVWIKVNQMVTLDTASKIFDILKNDGGSSKRG